MVSCTFAFMMRCTRGRYSEDHTPLIRLSKMMAVRCLITSLFALSTMAFCSLEYARLNSWSVYRRHNSWLIMPFTNCVPRSDRSVIGVPYRQTWLKSARAHGTAEVSLNYRMQFHKSGETINYHQYIAVISRVFAHRAYRVNVEDFHGGV